MNWIKNQIREKLGKQHREDGPAIEWTDGSKFWYRNGKLHREDGPAIEYANGSKYWRLNGKEYTEEDIENAQREIELKQAQKELKEVICPKCGEVFYVE